MHISLPRLHQRCYWLWFVIVIIRFPCDLSPVFTTRVDGPSRWVSGFHYPSTQPVNFASGNREPVNTMETGHPSTRAVTLAINSGSGNRALVFLLHDCSKFAVLLVLQCLGIGEALISSCCVHAHHRGLTGSGLTQRTCLCDLMVMICF